MTKKEFIEQFKDIPDDAEIKVFDFEHLRWSNCEAYWYNGKTNTTQWLDQNNKKINNFIGIE